MIFLYLSFHTIGHYVGRIVDLILDVFEALLPEKAGDLLLSLAEVLFESNQLDFPLVDDPKERKLEFFKGLEHALVNSFSKHVEVNASLNKLGICLLFSWIHLV